MFCPKCGAQNLDTSRFCKGCGAPLGGAPQAPMSAMNAAGGAPMGGAPMGGAPMGAMPMGGAQAAAMKPMALIKGNKNLPKIIIGVVALLAFALIVFSVVSCVFGGGLKPGVYTIQSGSEVQSLVVNEDKTIGMSAQGMQMVFAYEEAGSQGDSVLYDLRLKSLNGMEVQYDTEGNIANLMSIASSLSSFYKGYGFGSSDLNGMVSMKLSMQMMLPRGATYGNIAGDWGFRYYMSATASSGSASQTQAACGAFLAKFDNSGTVQTYSVDRSEGVNPYANPKDVVPEMTMESILASGGSAGSTLFWQKVTDNSFTLTTNSGSSSNTATITMPS